jgi:hypothetical protein
MTYGSIFNRRYGNPTKMNYRKAAAIVATSLLTLGVLASVLLTGNVSAQPISPPSLDGSAEGACGSCTSLTLTLSTTKAPDVVIVYEGYGGTCVTPNLPTDTAGLVYSLREAATYCNNMAGYEYYSVASAPLSGDTITCSAQGRTFVSCIAFAVSGANAAAPFDLSKPFVTSTGSGHESGNSCPQGSSVSYPCIVSLSTSSPNDFVFDMGTDNADGVGTQTPGAGFTMIGATNTLGQNPQDGYVQYKIATSPLSGDKEPFSLGIVNGFIVIGDAIQGATSSSTTSSSTTSSSTTSSSTSTSSLETTVTSTCTVTFTLSGGSVAGWNGVC